MQSYTNVVIILENKEIIMADGADMAIDDMLTFKEMRLDFRTGYMGVSEAFDAGIVDELGFEAGTSTLLKTCRCCGEGGLYWKKLEGKWRLFNDKGIHKCPVVPLPKTEK